MREKMLRVRFSEVEFEALKRFAAAERLSMSDLVRRAVLPGPSFEERLERKLAETPPPFASPLRKKSYEPDPR